MNTSNSKTIVIKTFFLLAAICEIAAGVCVNVETAPTVTKVIATLICALNALEHLGKVAASAQQPAPIESERESQGGGASPASPGSTASPARSESLVEVGTVSTAPARLTREE